MKQLVTVKVASAIIAALGLTAGAVGVVGAATGTIGETGDGSDNTVNATDSVDTTKDNSAEVNLENNNPQEAVSGDALVEDNDTGGGATTGVASNGHTAGNTVGANFAADDPDEVAPGTGASAGTITGPTGDDSTNSVDAHTDYVANTTNTATVNITNNNNQGAYSGHATVTGNDEGGAATTGAATNTSTTTNTVSLTF